MKNIRAFIGMLRRESMQVQDDRASHCWTILEERNDWFQREDRPKRSFDDVFIPHEQQELLVSSVKKFIESREWYERNHIPYHFGVMLHGEPGTGKSSIGYRLNGEDPGTGGKTGYPYPDHRIHADCCLSGKCRRTS